MTAIETFITRHAVRTGSHSAEEDRTMESVNLAFFDAYLEAWNAHDSAAVGRHIADDAMYEDAALGRVLHGPSEIASFVDEATRSQGQY